LHPFNAPICTREKSYRSIINISTVVPLETLWGTIRFMAAMMDTLAFLTEDNEKE
jgi:hypothetical protein